MLALDIFTNLECLANHILMSICTRQLILLLRSKSGFQQRLKRVTLGKLYSGVLLDIHDSTHARGSWSIDHAPLLVLGDQHQDHRFYILDLVYVDCQDIFLYLFRPGPLD